mgnify:CR=1 FL=1|tara:strand:+ start:30 stop:404 length:375 start_codon:yes stop_codon:yes gene_type:complete
MAKHPYDTWEDYLNGMYLNECKYSDNECKFLVKNIMSNRELFISVGKEVVDNWIVASEEFLSNKSSNRKSWIGQAICCYKYGIPELVVKKNWRVLTGEVRNYANESADIVLSYYDNKGCDNALI